MLAVGAGDGFEVVADAAGAAAVDDEAAGAAFVGSPAGVGVGTAPPVSVVPPWFPVVVPLVAAPLAEPDPAGPEPPCRPAAHWAAHWAARRPGAGARLAVLPGYRAGLARRIAQARGDRPRRLPRARVRR